MMNKKLFPIERLIGKIDNDFNIDHSDWIPRVSAWVIDALSQLNCLTKKFERRIFKITDKLATDPLLENVQITRVLCAGGFTINKCKYTVESFADIPCNHNGHSDYFIGVTVNSPAWEHNTQVTKVIGHNKCCPHSYIHTGNHIEISCETPFIVVEGYYLDTTYSNEYGCEIPYIYNNGLLIEALEMYCMYKILSRGYKHPVFTLTGPEPVNPYLQWKSLISKVKTSVSNQLQDEVGAELNWNNFFYDSTFLPRL